MPGQNSNTLGLDVVFDPNSVKINSRCKFGWRPRHDVIFFAKAARSKPAQSPTLSTIKARIYE